MGRQRAVTRRYFLGGRDLEMVEIARLLGEIGFADLVEDRALSWGARASDHATAIDAALAAAETPVLIELALDVDATTLARCEIVDHHGEQAGADRPSALRRVWRMLGADPARWTRWRALVEANDIGHIVGMAKLGASAAEIRAIRDADRAAQGVTPEIEAESRRAVAARKTHSTITIVETRAPTSSAVTDFIDRAYGGPGARNLLVIGPEKVSFFGDGELIERLRDWPGSWFGGALPERGYWGVEADQSDVKRITDIISDS